MTAPHDTQAHAQGAHGGVRSEEDRISTGLLVAVGIGSLVVFLVAGGAASFYLSAQKAAHGPVPIPAEVGRSKIAMVEQQEFDLSVRGQRDRAARLERLRSFGWVDRSAGVAHVPIDVAMGLVEKGVRPEAGRGQEERRVPGGQP